MRDLVLRFENSKTTAVYRFSAADIAPQSVAVEARKWLDSAVAKAAQSGACVVFFVSVHQAGTDCDHEVPGA
jgi:hypothetical protein